MPQAIKKTNFGKLDMKTKVFFRVVANVLPTKIKGQKSKLIKNHWWLSLKNWLHSFLGCISWDWSHLSSKSGLYYFLSALDECKGFLEINLIKESFSLIETLLKPHRTSRDDKMPLVINLLFCCQAFYSDIILTFSLKQKPEYCFRKIEL